MKSKFLLVNLLVSGFLFGCNTKVNTSVSCPPASTGDSLRNGDVVFQSSNGSQGLAIQFATKSQYNHCGLLYKENGQWYVYEAIQPVSKTLLSDWKNRGEDSTFLVMRSRFSDSSWFKDSVKNIPKEMKKHLGKTYDIYFNWGNDQLYCSELVWKLYKNVLGIELCKLKTFGDYDLSNPLVKKILKERFGNNIPLTQKVVAPDDLFEGLRRI